ncbi:MAG: hypothetical protein WCR04_09480 [Fibrobacteraceae bacterium]
MPSLENKEKLRKAAHYLGLVFAGIIVVLLVLVQMDVLSEEGDRLAELATDILGGLLALCVVVALLFKKRD